MDRKSDWASFCAKCEENYEGRLKSCPHCGNKAYLHSIAKIKNGVVVTKNNREALERHCRTTFPDDTLCVVPSISASTIGRQELAEEELRLAVQRQRVKESNLRRAEKKKKQLQKG